MERWRPTGVTGNGTDRKRHHMGRLHPAATDDLGSNVHVSLDERTGLAGVHGKNRSNSLPVGAQLQTEYLESLRALAQAYSIAQQRQTSCGGDAVSARLESGVTRRRSTTMIDTHRNRMDSELTSDSDHTFDHSSSLMAESGEVFTLPATDEEREKILSSRLQELDSAQRSWKKRVADYVHGLPANKALPGDPKRRRLWSTGCERLPWEIKSGEGVVPRRRITTVSSGDSTFSCSQLSTSSSRDSIQYWVDSIEGVDDEDTVQTSGHSKGDVKRTDSSSNAATARKVPDHEHVSSKPGPSSVDDDLGLGADAGSVRGPVRFADLGREQVMGPGDKVLERRLTNTDIINMAYHTRALQSRRKQLQRMGSSAMSDSSIASQSVSDLLFARNDPEELLMNLGFGGGKEANPLDRIPARFIKKPSTAHGISINNFMMLCETQDQKYGFSLHGGLRGLGAVLQNAVCSLPTLPQHLICKTDYGEDFPSLPEEDHISSILPECQEPLSGLAEEVPSASVNQEWSTCKNHDEDIQRSDGQVMLQPNLDLDKDPLRLENSLVADLEANSRTKVVPNDLPFDKYASTDAQPSRNDPVGTEQSESTSPSCAQESKTLGDGLYSSGISDSSDFDWDYEEVDPSGLKSLEDHRRLRNARMVILEPLLPPVDEEQEVSPGPQAQQHQEAPAADLKQSPKISIKDVEESPQQAGDCSAKKQPEPCLNEKKVISVTPELTATYLTHKQESFEIEEISSTENQDDGSAANRTSEKVHEKGTLLRTDSAQSDSSGFADEVMDVTVITNSPCMEDFHEHGSPHREGRSRPEMGNKLIQTSFDDFGVLESFDWDDNSQDPYRGSSDKPNGRSTEEETSSPSENERNVPSRKSSISSAERIARSRKSFRNSRSSYERMGSTFSGMSISTLEDSPFDGEGPEVIVGNTPVPRPRLGTYPTVAERHEAPPGPKTVVEILTTMQENIKQATEAKKLMEEENGASQVTKRPLLRKMKSVDLDCFPLSTSHEDTIDAVCNAEQVPQVLPDDKDVCVNEPEEVNSLENSNLSAIEVAENGIVEESGRSMSKLKRKPSQISMVPTLPCLDEEKTPAHSRHSSVTDTQNTALRQNHLPGHGDDTYNAPHDTNTTYPANCTVDDHPEDLDCVDLLSDTDTPVSMVANADSVGDVGDVGDLEEEMKYLEHVERLLRQEGKLLEEASPPRFRTRSRTEDKSFSPVQEEPLVQEFAINSHSSLVDCASSDRMDQTETTDQTSLLESDPPFQNHSGARLSLSDADDNADCANATAIPNPCSSAPNSPPHSPELVESSVCLYLSPPPFVIDFSMVSSNSNSAQSKSVFDSENLCNFNESELPQQRFRTSFEMALDGGSADKSNSKFSGNSTESISRVKPEDDLQDMKLIQGALFRYKQDLCELESLAERLYSRHLDEDGDERAEGGMTERERAELDSVRGLREQVMREVEVMEGQLAQRMRIAITRTNSEDGIQNSLTTSEDNLQVIQEMVKLLEEQRSLRRMLQDLETTHSCPSISDSSTCPELSVVGSVDWEESDHREGVGNMTTADKREMMQALTDVRLELQRQREVARREMNSAVREMRQAIITELRQELQLDVQLFQRQLQSKDKEIEQLKTLLRQQRSLRDGE